MAEQATAPVYSVVIPVYESDRSVSELVGRLHAVFQEEIAEPYEIILVDDGSRSAATWQTCQELARQDDRVRALRLMRNYGKPGAVLCGLEQAQGAWVITIDDDLQQRPEDIPRLIEHREHDVVVASFRSKQHGPLTLLTSWIKSHLDRIILGLPCKMSPLKLLRAEVARGMLQIRTPNPFIPALMAHVTNDFVAVEVPHERSRHGRSRYTLRRRFRQFSNLLIDNSTLLFRLIGSVGSAVSIGGFAFALVVVVRRLSGSPIPAGWPSLVVINLVFGGLILIALSLIGEYLLRVLEGISQKPPFIVRQVAGRHGPAQPLASPRADPDGCHGSD